MTDEDIHEAEWRHWCAIAEKALTQRCRELEEAKHEIDNLRKVLGDQVQRTEQAKDRIATLELRLQSERGANTATEAIYCGRAQDVGHTSQPVGPFDDEPEDLELAEGDDPFSDDDCVTVELSELNRLHTRNKRLLGIIHTMSSVLLEGHE